MTTTTRTRKAPSATPGRNTSAPADVATGAGGAPWLHWSDVHRYVNKAWDPEHAPHHSLIGLTGSGKSYLGINGILRPMCSTDRVLIIDSKGDDKLVSTQGRPVRQLENRAWYQGLGRKPKPFDHWQRLIVYGNRHTERAKAQAQVARALDRVFNEGNWVVYFDELIDISTNAPGLGLRAYVDEIYRMGRSRGISVVAATQSPVQVPRTFYDQASFAWLGRIRDKERQKRLLEIGGLTSDELQYVQSLKRQQWLLAADNGEFFARSKVQSIRKAA